MAESPDQETLKLTPLDDIMVTSYIRLVLSFPFTATSSSVKALTESLQVGIDHVVSQIPFLAGTLHPQEDASETGRSHVIYPASSPKVHLRVLDLPSFPHDYAALSAAKVPPSELSNELAPVPAFADPLSAPFPVFAIQATFIPGGVLLCVCVHHFIMDGTGFGAFLGLLADSCRSGGTSSCPDIQKIQDRAPCMLGLSEGEIPKEHPEYKVVDLDAQPQVQSAPPAIPSMTTRLFEFSTSSLTKLKDDITTHIHPTNHHSLPSFASTNDCLTALLWTSITRARQSSTTTHSRLGMAVNGRRHLPVIQAHLSNVNLFATASLPTSLLSSPSPADLTTTALTIRHAITAINSYHIRSTISLILSQRNIKSLTYGFHNFLGPDLAVTSWENIGVYGHDWGCGLGKPERVRPVTGGPPGFDGLAIVLPRKVSEGEGGEKPGLEVMVGLKAEDMERLEGDEVWKRYCDGKVG